MKYSFLYFIFFVPSLFAQNFELQQMPHGKEITLTKSALVLAPLNARIKFSSTDSPQTLKFSGPGPALKLSIADDATTNSKMIEIKPGATFLYTFKSLASIKVDAEFLDKKSIHSANHFLIESDKPLTVSW